MSHSTGPWKAYPGGVYGGPLASLCLARRHQEERDDALWNANARLMAAAPDLLAALDRCKDYLSGPWTAPEDVCDQVKAAILKATGR